ncbi:MAG TPA: hypothetical protein VF070_20535 [Streptosporangiaceae bacterium]
MTTELVGKAESTTDKERARRHPDLARHSSRLAAAVEVLLEVTDSGGEITLSQVWVSIEAIVPRRQLRESVDAVARPDSMSPRSGVPERSSRAMSKALCCAVLALPSILRARKSCCLSNIGWSRAGSVAPDTDRNVSVDCR